MRSAEHIGWIAGIGVIEIGQQHAPEERMLIALLIIDLAHNLVFVVEVSLAENDFSAGIIRLRETRGNVLRRWAEQSRIDMVVDKTSGRTVRVPVFQRDRSSCVTCTKGKGRKVTGEHRGRRNVTSDVAGILPDRCALITAEEKQLVPADRAADGSAVLVALEGAAYLVAGFRIYCREVRRRVKQIVANEFEQVAV